MRNVFRKLRNILFSIFFSPIIFFYSWVYKGKKAVFCECYMHSTLLPFTKRNWGDDLNKYFFEYVSNVKIVNLPFSQMLKCPNTEVYSLIGSVLSSFRTNNKIVYGTGIMDPQREILGIPREIISVRGPRTRQVLLENGIDCPECYGDPVLLLPIFYNRRASQVNCGGLILNMGTNSKNFEFINEVIRKYNLKMISMTDYEKWTDVVDEICSCQFIISESLHGLIVAETYGIPNVWVEFMDHPEYWDFKYIDYYESIGKSEEIIKVKTMEDVEAAIDKAGGWEKGNIDYNELIRLYPFQIHNSFVI